MICSVHRPFPHLSSFLFLFLFARTSAAHLSLFPPYHRLFLGPPIEAVIGYDTSYQLTLQPLS